MPFSEHGPLQHIYRAIGFLLVLWIVMCGFFIGVLVWPHRFIDPLGGKAYAVQTVASRVVGVDGPAVRYGDSAVIEGRLCIPRGPTVRVLTTLSWQAFVGGHEQTGTFVTVGAGIPQRRRGGCEEHTVAGGNPFVNPVPSEVVHADQALRAQGLVPHWRVIGGETPLLADNTFGARKSFRSALFELVP